MVGHPAVKLGEGSRGGVLILVDKGIEARPYKEIPSSTSMWSAVIISTSGSRGSSSNILVGTVYLPPEEEALNMQTLHDISIVTRGPVSLPMGRRFQQASR